MANEANPVMTREVGPLWAANSSGEAPATMACHLQKHLGIRSLFLGRVVAGYSSRLK